MRDVRLHHVQYLFFNLFQFIFHLNHDFLHFGMIGLAAQCIDFTSHFLSDKSQFLALSVAAFQRTDKIFQMVAKALFLLVDIQLFDIVNQLLLQAVFVVVHT